MKMKQVFSERLVNEDKDWGEAVDRGEKHAYSVGMPGKKIANRFAGDLRKNGISHTVYHDGDAEGGSYVCFHAPTKEHAKRALGVIKAHKNRIADHASDDIEKDHKL